MQLTDGGTPVAEIQEGAQFRHWCHGVVTVTGIEPNQEKGITKLLINAANGATAVFFRRTTRITLIED